MAKNTFFVRGGHLLWLWAQVMVVEQENQGRSGAILIEGVLFVLHFEWDFPNVNDS